jgi:nitrogen fixation/metabolism regulation signal transduction histidine kinase
MELVSVISNVILALCSVVLVVVGIRQLNNLVKDNSIKTVLEIESLLQQNQTDINRFTSKVRMGDVKGDLTDEMREIYKDDKKALMEIYLNTMDRLCYCILRDYLKDRDWKSEYRELLENTIRKNTDKFQAGTHFKNIMKLYDKWK